MAAERSADDRSRCAACWPGRHACKRANLIGSDCSGWAAEWHSGVGGSTSVGHHGCTQLLSGREAMGWWSGSQEANCDGGATAGPIDRHRGACPGRRPERTASQKLMALLDPPGILWRVSVSVRVADRSLVRRLLALDQRGLGTMSQAPARALNHGFCTRPVTLCQASRCERRPKCGRQRRRVCARSITSARRCRPPTLPHRKPPASAKARGQATCR